MSSFAKKVKRFYEDGLWSRARVRDAVEKGRITEAEYQQITGEPYAQA